MPKTFEAPPAPRRPPQKEEEEMVEFPPQKEEGEMVKLDQLPSELLMYILSLIRSQSDLWSLLFVSKRISLHAQETLWSEPFLNSERDFHLWLTNLWKVPSISHLSSPAAAPVSHIHLVGSDSGDGGDDPLVSLDVPMADRDPASRRISLSELNEAVKAKNRTRSCTVGNRSLRHHHHHHHTHTYNSNSMRPPTPPPSHSTPEYSATLGQQGRQKPHTNYYYNEEKEVIRGTFARWIKHLYLDNESIRHLIDDATLNRILLATGPRLQRLDLGGCDELTHSAFDILSPSSRRPNLPHFNNSETTTTTTTTTFETSGAGERFETGGRLRRGVCVNLEAISLKGCVFLTADALKRLFSVTKKVKILNLDRVNAVDASVLATIGENCRSLHGLSLNGCYNVTDDGMIRFLSALTSSDRSTFVSGDKSDDGQSIVRELSLNDCTKLTDVAIQFVAEKCAHLSYLRLTGCRLISDRSLCSIISRCQDLQYLFLARCAITDQTLLQFKHIHSLPPHHHHHHHHHHHQLNGASGNQIRSGGGRRSKLLYIDLAYASSLTLPSLMEMVFACPDLVSIGLGACHNIIKYRFVKELSEPPGNDLPANIRDSYCVFRSGETIDRLKQLYIRQFFTSDSQF